MTLPITDPTWIFLVVLAIILCAPALFTRLKVPSIVGLIFAGVLVGPFGFHVLERDASFELFGKVGIYYIMFLASLEMNMQDIRKTRTRALGFGLLSFAIPFALGFVANWGLLRYGVMASLLMAAMYASHTLISYPIVLRYGLSQRQSVNMAVGGTIVADTLTLLVLAIVSETFKAPVSTWFWLIFSLKFAVVAIVIIWIFPTLARWFFKRINDGVVQYIFVLGLVFLGAGLMEVAGMEGILGAFFVGIILNKQIPATSPLMNHIEFIGNALFIPYFLISVGMIIDIRALANLNALEVAAVMIIVGMSGKWLATWGAQQAYRLRRNDRNLIFGLSNSRAAATLAIVLVGYNILLPDGSHLLSEAVLNGAMILILVSCIVSSIVTEKAARHIASEIDTTEDTDHTDDSDDRIVLALSYSNTVDPLVHLALMLRSPESPAPLSAINIVLESDEDLQKQGKLLLERAARIAAATNVRMQTHSRWSVNVVSGLSHAMKELDATDLLIGLHQRTKLFESFFGKVSTDLFAAVDRQIIAYRALQPINTIRGIHLVVPKHAEFEPCFSKWTKRMALLSTQLSCAIQVYAPHHTSQALRNQWERTHSNINAHYHEYNSRGDYFPIARQMRQDHLAVFILARPGTISYHHYFQRLPDQLERHFSTRNLMIIYPAQFRGTIGKTSVLITK